MTEQPDDQWLTRREAAELCRVAPRTFDRWTAAGRVPVHRTPGGHPRFRRGEVEALVSLDPERPGPGPSAPALL